MNMSSELIAEIIVLTPIVLMFILPLFIFLEEECHITDKIFKTLINWFEYWFEPIEKDLLDIKPASFVDYDGERVYVTSDREVFYGYYSAKEHEEDILLEMYLKYGLIDKRTAARRTVTTRIWIKENSRFKKWLYNSKLKASPTTYLLE